MILIRIFLFASFILQLYLYTKFNYIPIVQKEKIVKTSFMLNLFKRADKSNTFNHILLN